MIIERYVCDFCHKTLNNKEKCQNCKNNKYKPSIVQMRDIPYGTMVRINKKALKSYYTTESCIDGYMIGSAENGNMDFISFYKDHRFNAGLDCGIVTGYGADIFYAKVKYFDALGNWSETYVNNWDLEVIEEL